MYQRADECLREAVTLSSSPTVSAVLSDPQVWAVTFVRAVGETLSGRRSPSALSALTTSEVREILHRRPVPGPRGARPDVRSLQPGRVHTRRLADDVVEANAVLLGPDGGRAVAFRMEARRDRWICTALETRRPAHPSTLMRP
jgi:hypothetical protein